MTTVTGDANKITELYAKMVACTKEDDSLSAPKKIPPSFHQM